MLIILSLFTYSFSLQYKKVFLINMKFTALNSLTKLS